LLDRLFHSSGDLDHDAAIGLQACNQLGTRLLIAALRCDGLAFAFTNSVRLRCIKETLNKSTKTQLLRY
jgi:hypothetical protein